METRTCARCGAERSVAGVWYLLDAERGRFVCGSCYGKGGEAGRSPAEDELRAEP